MKRKPYALHFRRSSAESMQAPALGRGFTLPELIAVLVITGILAAVAAPRLMSRGEFDVFGFAEQSASMIRYAQKTAIAKRRYVCVRYIAPYLAVTFDPNAGGVAPCTSASRVLNPAGEQTGSGRDYQIEVPSGVNIASSSGSTSVAFDTQGRPVGLTTALTITVSGGNASRAIVIEPETGYVH